MSSIVAAAPSATQAASAFSVDSDAPQGAFKCLMCTKDAQFSCGQCGRYYYCSSECQELHWETHQSECGDIKVKPIVRESQVDLNEPIVFVHKPPSNLFCALKGHLLRTPVVAPCGHSFCRQCAIGYAKKENERRSPGRNFNEADTFIISCPVDGEPFDVSLLYPILALENAVLNLSVRCKYACKQITSTADDGTSESEWVHDADGCPAVLTIGNRRAHEAMCSYERLACPHDKRCGLIFRKDWDDHVERCKQQLCPNRTKGCLFEGTIPAWQDHIKVCTFNVLRSFIEETIQEMGYMKKELTARDTQLASLTKENAALKAEVATMSSERAVKELWDEVTKAAEGIRTLSSKESVHDQEIQEIMQQVTGQQKSIISLADRLQTDITSCEENLKMNLNSVKEEHRSQMSAGLDALASQQKMGHDLLDQRMEEIRLRFGEIMEADREKMEIHVAGLKDELRKANAERGMQSQKQEEQVAHVQKDVEALRMRQGESAEELKRVVQEQMDFAVQLKQAGDWLQQLDLRDGELQLSIQATNAVLPELEGMMRSTRGALEEKLEGVQGRISQERLAVQDVRDEIADLREQLLESNRDVSSVAMQLPSYQQDILAVAHRLNTMQERINDCSEQIQSVLGMFEKGAVASLQSERRVEDLVETTSKRTAHMEAIFASMSSELETVHAALAKMTELPAMQQQQQPQERMRGGYDNSNGAGRYFYPSLGTQSYEGRTQAIESHSRPSTASSAQLSTPPEMASAPHHQRPPVRSSQSSRDERSEMLPQSSSLSMGEHRSQDLIAPLPNAFQQFKAAFESYQKEVATRTLNRSNSAMAPNMPPMEAQNWSSPPRSYQSGSAASVGMGGISSPSMRRSTSAMEYHHRQEMDRQGNVDRSGGVLPPLVPLRKDSPPRIRPAQDLSTGQSPHAGMEVYREFRK
jgi:hypothetical protein